MERSLRLLFGATVLALSASGARAESLIADPCAGSSGLLALIDRPTVADNPCAVPPRSVVVEGGVQWSAARGGGRAVNLPEAVVRVGLDGRNELVVLAPNFFRQAGSGADASGFGAATVGLKHELGYTERWLGAIEALATLPSGSAAYGSQHVGVAVNGIVSYAASDHVGLSLMLGVSSQTLAKADGGTRYFSVNPDFVATWVPVDRIQFYGEVYGQTRTGPGERSGWNVDGGVLYLVAPDIVVDTEVGRRLAGNLGGFRHYVGVGFGVRF